MGSRQSLTNWIKSLDVVVACVCFFAFAVASTPNLELQTVGQFLSLRITVGNVLLFLLLLGAWHLSLLLAGTYDSCPTRLGLRNVLGIARGTASGIALWLLAGAVLDISFITVEFLLRVWASIALTMIGIRALMTSMLARRHHDRFLRNILIVGINPRALRIAKDLEDSSDFGYRVVGFVDDSSMASFPLKSTLAELPDYLRSTAVDEVIVCLPIKSQFDRIVDIVKCCEDQGITVRVAADILADSTNLISAQQLGANTLLSLHPHAINGAGAATKRLIDVLGSALIIVALSPLLAITAIVVMLSSAGPIFFLQDRVGRNKKIFRMIKFRTMVADAPAMQSDLEAANEANGPVFKIKYDPRITPIGGFLRRTSIDELPQLFNVFKGEMSLVGPRPLPVRDYEGFSEDWHRRRFSVRPGISGLWQVAGRSNLPFDQWMELDLKYINEWSLALDFKVLLLTVPAVFKGTGAT